MRETHFIQQNKEKWTSFENVLEDTDKDPDKLHDVFIQITDDLSHARTFYPSRSVRAYLNGVAQLIFTDIYKQKKSPLSKLKHFFTEEMPQVIYESRWSFFWAWVFFILSFAIGYFSGMKDPEFSKTILGDSYVNMTVENIKSGDPMAVYKKSGRFDMTMGIMVNNMGVTLMYFILGIFAGIGSVAMMMYNGVMVGVFLQFFAQNNLLKEANLTIWMHGTFEISAIVIGTAAGITMGRGLLFPGTYTRLQAFQMSARRGIKILVGVMILLFFAAIIEGNLTRHTEFGDGFRAVFIGLNLAFLIFYYIWYPFYKAKKGFKQPFKEAHLPPDNFYKIVYQKIKSSGEIFGDTFIFFKKYMKTYLWTASILSAIFLGIIFLTSSYTADEIFKLQTDVFSQWTIFFQLYSNEKLPLLPYLNGIIYTILIFIVYRMILRGEKNIVRPMRDELYPLLKMTTVMVLVMLWVAASGWWLTVFFLGAMPFIALWLYLIYRDGYNIVGGIKHAWWLMGSGVGMSYGTHYILFAITYLFFAFSSSGIFYFYMLFVGWNLSFLSVNQFDNVVVILTAFVSIFALLLNFMLFFTAYAFLYYSLLEINLGQSLLDKIAQIGMGKKIQGMARE
jgi:uncharacterized membrane protein SpoIIM required for sporulation